MIVRHLLAALLLGALAAHAADTQTVAFVLGEGLSSPAKNAAAMAEASLSKTVQVLERQKVDAILKEHTLALGGASGPKRIVSGGKLLKADVLLLCLPVKGMDGVMRFLGVDSETGIRLLDESVELTKTDTAAKRLIEHAQRACSTQSELEKSAVFVSILPVRTAEPGDLLRPTCDALELALGRGLANRGLVVLERSYVEAIQEEKFLSAEWTNRLKSSTVTIDAEIERSDKGRTLNARVSLQQPGGKSSSVSTHAAPMSDLPKLNTAIADAVAKQLKASAPSKLPTHAEEGRYFMTQARRLFSEGHAREALKTARAALLFIPDDKRCVNFVAYLMIDVHDYRTKKRFTAKHLENAVRTIEFCMHPLCEENPAELVYDGRTFYGSGGTFEQRDSTRKAYNTMVTTRMNRAIAAKDLKDLAYQIRNAFFASNYAPDSFDEMMTLRELWLETFTALSEKPASEGRDDALSDLASCTDEVAILREFELALAKKAGPRWRDAWAGLCSKLEKHPQTMAQFVGRLARMEVTDKADYPKMVKEAFRDVIFMPAKTPHLDTISMLTAKAVSRLEPAKQLAFYEDRLWSAIRSKRSPNKAFVGLTREVMRNHYIDTYNNSGGKPKERLERYLLKVAEYQRVITAIPESTVRNQVLKELKERVDSERADMVAMVGSKAIWETSKKLFSLSEFDFVGKGKNWRVMRSHLCGETLFSLVRQNHRKTVYLISYNLETGDKKTHGQLSLPNASWLAFRFDISMTASPDCVFFGSQYAGVMAFPLDGKEPYTITAKNGLPSDQVSSIDWAKDRLFLGVGDFSTGGFGALVAFDPKTKTTELIASSRRRDGKGLLDGKRIYSVSGMFWDDAKECLWFCLDAWGNDSRSGLWQLKRTEKGYVYKKVWTGKGGFSPMGMRRTAGGFLLFSDGSPSQVIRLEIPSFKSELVYEKIHGEPKKASKATYLDAVCYRMAMEVRHFALHGKTLVTSFPYGIGISEPGKPPSQYSRPDKESYSLGGLLEHPKGVIAVWRNQVWQLTNLPKAVKNH